MTECSVLRAHIETFEESTQRVRDLLGELDPDLANRQPHPGSWSALQALEHLNVTARVYHTRLARSLAEAGPGSGPYGKGTRTGRLMIKQMQPGKHRPMKAPKVFRPPTTALTVVRVLDDFQRGHDEWIRLLQEADGKDLETSRVRLPLPIPIHLSVAQTFDVHALHVPRHVAQAERAVQAVRAASA